ncbi:hypothetical protein [Herbaspirillum huttiense]|uniref:hypothetical protein n=1 Tax=Herbaspirillum huttiense TaxID=863372 RepID=UPI0039AFC280
MVLAGGKKGKENMSFFGVIFYLAVMAAATLWNGYVASTLWGWFIVPLGVSAITYWHAVGLSAVVGVFFGGSFSLRSDGESPVEAAFEDILKAALVPLFCLGIGWVAKQYM